MLLGGECVRPQMLRVVPGEAAKRHARQDHYNFNNTIGDRNTAVGSTICNIRLASNVIASRHSNLFKVPHRKVCSTCSQCLFPHLHARYPGSRSPHPSRLTSLGDGVLSTCGCVTSTVPGAPSLTLHAPEHSLPFLPNGPLPFLTRKHWT